jgi:hypothetical protein
MALRLPLDSDIRAKLAELTTKLPESKVRRLVGDLSPEAFARALAGLPVQRGTVLMIQDGLARMAKKAA